MDQSRDQGPLRTRRATLTTTFTFPIGALVAALLVFVTADLTVGLVGGLLVALIPWALLCGGVRLGPLAMVVAGVGIPAAVVLGHAATGAAFLAMLAVAWLAADGRSRPAELTALAASMAIPIVDVGSNPANYPSNGWVYLATGSLFSWFIGRMLHRERELVGALTEAHSRLHDAAAAAERQRIARDVHDVVGHSLTVVLLNVMGARRVLTLNPRAAAEALDRAEQVGRDSLDSVRTVVELLRAPGTTAANAPRAPGVADIAALARTAVDAGLPVHLEVEGDLDRVDACAGLGAFRLVQEAISNVEHHAPGAAVVVRIVIDGEQLAVSVQNGPAAHHVTRSCGGGAGLAGMHERIGALGGSLSAGPDGDGWR
ncbi:MAG: histidine kinase, partial [Actinobacteria bacterium]|nr:histidine kinase [Actinomycetota bacterium]